MDPSLIVLSPCHRPPLIRRVAGDEGERPGVLECARPFSMAVLTTGLPPLDCGQIAPRSHADAPSELLMLGLRFRRAASLYALVLANRRAAFHTSMSAEA